MTFATVAVKASFLDRDALLQLDGATFFITDHYRAYPWVLVRLSTVGQKRLKDVLEQAWRLAAPKRLLASTGSVP